MGLPKSPKGLSQFLNLAFAQRCRLAIRHEPKLGGFFVLLGTNPLFAGAAGVLVAVGVLLPSRKPKYSERLKHLLIHSAQEQRRIKPSAALAITLLWVLVIASIAATVLQLIQGLPLFPRVSWSLVAMITAFAILIGFWEFNGDGRGQPEPKKSMAILGPRLHRVPPEVEIAGVNDTVIRMKSASQLRNVKEHGNLPVFHQIDVATRTHKFWIITDAAVYTWQVQSQLKEPLADARLNSANEI